MNANKTGKAPTSAAKIEPTAMYGHSEALSFMIRPIGAGSGLSSSSSSFSAEVFKESCVLFRGVYKI